MLFGHAIDVTSACEPRSWENATDFFGNDLHAAKATTPEECCAACTNTDGCKAWTLWEGGPQCYLKTSDHGRRTKEQHTSGRRAEPSPSGCASDLDCSLNGLCGEDGLCACDVPWSGETCGLLVMEPAAPGGLYGFDPNVTSWGGNVLEGDDGLFHLFVSEIDGGLASWTQKSQCVHATSANIQGPFQRADVAVGAQCHNTAPIRDPVSGEYLIFHIGSGPSSGSSFMHHSSSPDGPWLPALTTPGGCNNPAPEFHPNGTLFVICSSGDVTSAPSWDGPWTAKRSIGSRPFGWEDAHLWFDRRGNWHIIYHVWTNQPWPVIRYSAHAFSRDGWEWKFEDAVEPYGGTIHFTDGSSKSFATIERPQLVFADASRSTPVAMVNGVSPQIPGPQCATCTSNWCSSCKQTAGRDWDYTVLQPLQGFSASRFGPATIV